MKIQYFFLIYLFILCENYFNICQNNIFIVEVAKEQYTMDTQKEKKKPHIRSTTFF